MPGLENEDSPEDNGMGMLKHYLSYFFVIALLITAGMIMVRRSSGTLKQDIHDFIPPHLEEVDQVSISNKSQHILLRKVLNSWELQSNGKARSQVVDLFFTGLQRLEIVSPASKADRREISQDLENNGKLVSFFHHEKRLRTFYIGYDSIDVQGTYIMDVKRKLPYRLKLKGYAEVNLENLFSLKIETWQKK
jgi:hypothetical protein